MNQLTYQNLDNQNVMQLGCERILRHSHIRPALDHFWAIRPDSHLTISIFAWYLPLKDWNLYYVFAHLLAIWPFLSLFDPTRTRPFAICIDLYSTNLVSVHSLISRKMFFQKINFITICTFSGYFDSCVVQNPVLKRHHSDLFHAINILTCVKKS